MNVQLSEIEMMNSKLRYLIVLAESFIRKARPVQKSLDELVEKIADDSIPNYSVEFFPISITIREMKVLKLRFIDKLSFEEVGKLLGVSRERIRQIEAKAIEKLKESFVIEQ